MIVVPDYFLKYSMPKSRGRSFDGAPENSILLHLNSFHFAKLFYVSNGRTLRWISYVKILTSNFAD